MEEDKEKEVLAQEIVLNLAKRGLTYAEARNVLETADLTIRRKWAVLNGRIRRTSLSEILREAEAYSSPSEQSQSE